MNKGCYLLNSEICGANFHTITMFVGRVFWFVCLYIYISLNNKHSELVERGQVLGHGGKLIGVGLEDVGQHLLVGDLMGIGFIIGTNK